MMMSPSVFDLIPTAYQSKDAAGCGFRMLAPVLAVLLIQLST